MTDQLYRPWGTVTPDFWLNTTPDDEPDPGAIPPAYAERITTLIALYESKDPESLIRAAAEADALDHDLTVEYGADHLFTLQLRDLRGWLCHLTGQHAAGVHWCLHTLRAHIRVRGAGHRLAADQARRTCQIWRYVTDLAEARSTGEMLLPLLEDVLGTDSTEARAVRIVLGRIGARPPAS
ncbi:hypothetical protein SRB5_53240 [Streptomyces sp. RB5]|uniref:Uncharacterized protein n=1 Tax=Streptomyces smaragdinus TaxID=2585196 RepID=A0A7K0CNS6_9ACTN|nr:hypothetical protein [Streptomyces smaragdinus]MQY15146.1 hypothetical protein [Streptomyces smaragdinus]